MNARPGDNGWSLEVVRGQDSGRRYALPAGELILGNAPGPSASLDLSDQEGTTPRRMAAQQAKLDCSAGTLKVSDLDSPGGTFVNRQRILPGQARALQGGDVIQLGGVQLRVVAGGALAPSTSTKPLSPLVPPTQGATELPRPSAPSPATRSAGFPFTLKSGATCRSWDDFLTVSAQRWGDLRDELTSGRLAAFAAAIGRADLSPDPHAPGTPDERLDLWIGRLPTNKPAQPELDVHPATLAIRVAPGGGSTRRKLQIHNTGHRLLRATASIEPAGTTWIRVAPECAGKTIVAVEDAELPLEVTSPETYRGVLKATVVIDSNGGSRRVAVTLEPPVAADEIPAAAPGSSSPVDWGIRSWVAGQSRVTRLAGWSLAAVLVRVAIGLAAKGIGPASESVLALAGPALVMAMVGAVAGMVLALRRDARTELPACGLAGAIGGILVASLGVAACQAVEPILGPSLGRSIFGAAMLWGLIGLAAAAVSLVLAPAKDVKEIAR